MIHILRKGAALAGCFTCLSGWADGSFQSFVALSGTTGGNSLKTVKYTDGTTQDIRSGGRFDIAAGVDYWPSERSPYSLQASVGVHRAKVTGPGKDGSIYFSRLPVEALAYWYPSGNFRVGGGLRKATDAKFKTSGAANDSPDFRMTSSLGLVVQADYYLMPQISFMARVVTERYKSPMLPGGSVDGSHLGLGVAFHF